MKPFEICQVFSRGSDGGLFVTNATIQEIRFAKGMAWSLRKLVEKKERTKGRGAVDFDNIILGKIWFNCRYTGGKARWVNEVRFDEDGTLGYEEIRHGIQLAIFHLTGLYSNLQVSWLSNSATWRLLGGVKMFDAMRDDWEIVDNEDSRGVVYLSRVVTRDIKKGGGK